MKIYNSLNKEWLEPIAIFFGKGDLIYRILANKIGENALDDGWYDIQGDLLNHIAICGEIELNNHLLPVGECET